MRWEVDWRSIIACSWILPKANKNPQPIVLEQDIISAIITSNEFYDVNPIINRAGCQVIIKDNLEGHGLEHSLSVESSKINHINIYHYLFIFVGLFYLGLLKIFYIYFVILKIKALSIC